MELFRLIGLAIFIAFVMILIGLSVYLGFIFYFVKKHVKKFKERFD